MSSSMSSRLIEEMRETAQGLHSVGLIDKRRMEELEALYRVNQIQQYTGESVKTLRERLQISQAALAIIINTSPHTVRAWEANKKKPSGQSCLLLDLLDRKGVEALL
ncbi:MAG: transcriptional regulator [Pseudomonadota bacterium]